MRVALLSTCAISTPPKAYGGTELVVSEIAKGLTRLGHDVTVFATGDSEPAGTLHATVPRPIWPPDEFAELRHAALAMRDVDPRRFDILHANHAAALPLTLLRRIPTVVTIHHARVDGLISHYQGFPDVDLVAISQRQADLIPELRVTNVVHHGLDVDFYPEGDGRGGYCAFLGRLAPEKAPHLAIDAALAAGVPLRIGGEAHEVARGYLSDVLNPRLEQAKAGVTCLGELSHAPKVELLRGARCLLFPLAWEEPFGLVMIESMLVGTPVIAFARGSAPEVIEDGVTGYLVHTVDEMTDALRRVGSINRAACRAQAQKRWSNTRMVRDYLRVYARTIAAHADHPGRARDPNDGDRNTHNGHEHHAAH